MQGILLYRNINIKVRLCTDNSLSTHIDFVKSIMQSAVNGACRWLHACCARLHSGWQGADTHPKFCHPMSLLLLSLYRLWLAGVWRDVKIIFPETMVCFLFHLISCLCCVPCRSLVRRPWLTLR
jgi:hypothetical protein